MSFIPNIENYTTELKEQEYNDFLLDKNTMKFTAIGNQKESLRMWIEWAIDIKRYKYSIFPYEYGCELYKLLEQAHSEEETKELAEYYIIEALKVLEYIDEVVVKEIKIENKKIKMKVFIKTIYGEKIDYEYI